MLSSLSDEEWDRHQAVPVQGAFLTLGGCSSQMIEQGSGSLIAGASHDRRRLG
jgi:NAD(P)-dependent dehydrogenase (short-subunit alcohol dehydrogenase family)